MSVFMCNRCDKQFDSDFVGCYEDPKDKCELICRDCYFVSHNQEDEFDDYRNEEYFS